MDKNAIERTLAIIQYDQKLIESRNPFVQFLALVAVHKHRSYEWDAFKKCFVSPIVDLVNQIGLGEELLLKYTNRNLDGTYELLSVWSDKLIRQFQEDFHRICPAFRINMYRPKLTVKDPVYYLTVILPKGDVSDKTLMVFPHRYIKSIRSDYMSHDRLEEVKKYFMQLIALNYFIYMDRSDDVRLNFTMRLLSIGYIVESCQQGSRIVQIPVSIHDKTNEEYIDPSQRAILSDIKNLLDRFIENSPICTHYAVSTNFRVSFSTLYNTALGLKPDSRYYTIYEIREIVRGAGYLIDVDPFKESVTCTSVGEIDISKILEVSV